jgi:hypothetical protein
MNGKPSKQLRACIYPDTDQKKQAARHEKRQQITDAKQDRPRDRMLLNIIHKLLNQKNSVVEIHA